MGPSYMHEESETDCYRELHKSLPYRISFKEYVTLLEEGLQHLKNGIVIVDKEANVIFFSDSYQDFLNIKRSEVLGRHCTRVIENSRMHFVVASGVAEIGDSHHIKKQDMVVQRIPIEVSGETKGAIGQVMFKNVEDVISLAKNLDILESKLKIYEDELYSFRRARYSFENIIGESQATARAKKEAVNASKTSAPVLLIGDSGTGKELFAHAIHNASARGRKPFVRLNCAALPAELLESELFGYEPGSFTGASKKGKPGKFELANGGTIYLDEIGGMPPKMQATLLRVLQEKEFERIGGTKIIRSDFRVIASTNRPLEELVNENTFRKDLYYRLNVIPIQIPPLRERAEDIPGLVAGHLTILNEELGTGRKDVSHEAMEILKSYDWPGNVRELQNILERIVCSIQGQRIKPEHLPPFLWERTAIYDAQPTEESLQNIMNTFEKKVIERTLAHCGGNKALTARKLGLHRTALYKKMKKLGIEKSETAQRK